jgi:tripartite-type tricarboxylate transporter receptor subunit TctC
MHGDRRRLNDGCRFSEDAPGEKKETKTDLKPAGAEMNIAVSKRMTKKVGKKFQKGEVDMNFFKKNRVMLGCLIAIMVGIINVGAGYAAGAEKYPSKAITLIVPFAPGGGVDLIARIMADLLSKEWGVPVNVVNKEGGNTVIGTLEMLRSKPDGYTIMADNQASASFQVVLPNLPYRIEDRTNLGTSTVNSSCFSVNSKSPWKDLKDVVAAAKKDPENFKWASLGGVSTVDLNLYQFFESAGINVSRTKIVRFKGAGDAVIALAGGHVDFAATGIPVVMSYIQSGMVRVLAVSSRQEKSLPSVKTVPEQGFGEVSSGWQGYSGPLGLPKEVVAAWEKALEKIVLSDEWRTRIQKIGYDPMFLKGNEFHALILKDSKEALKYLVQKK